ncbi:MAG TPA: histidine phosphatase family protein [Ohtaekwangia sp.]|uniref:SixA phosphatase family protein n=1 Tax=Ohtaekwangia sp. TaxID=2066019 RepID=UPI002F926FEB
MKTLYIVRHAKSSWANPLQDDYDRPLNERGKNDAPRMGKRLKEKDIHPDLIISSPAKRAYSTAKRIAEVLKYAKEKIKTKKSLYHADEEAILSLIQGLKDKYNSVILFGHNPGLTEFVNSFQDAELDIDNVPTCGVVAFQLNIDSWKDATWGKGKMLFFDYPKSKED